MIVRGEQTEKTALNVEHGGPAIFRRTTPFRSQNGFRHGVYDDAVVERSRAGNFVEDRAMRFPSGNIKTCGRL